MHQLEIKVLNIIDAWCNHEFYVLFPLGVKGVTVIKIGNDFVINIICVDYTTFNVSE